jgi:hypothetical protein
MSREGADSLRFVGAAPHARLRSTVKPWRHSTNLGEKRRGPSLFPLTGSF